MSERNDGKPMGKLHGVIIGIKDVIAYKDHPLSASSKILKGFTSIYSATAVEKLLAEDAIIIGSLNCDEFAMGSTNENSAYGKVLNSLDEYKNTRRFLRRFSGCCSGRPLYDLLRKRYRGLSSAAGGFLWYCGLKARPMAAFHGMDLLPMLHHLTRLAYLATNVPDIALALESNGRKR